MRFRRLDQKHESTPDPCSELLRGGASRRDSFVFVLLYLKGCCHMLQQCLVPELTVTKFPT